MDRLLRERDIEDKVIALVAEARRNHGIPEGAGGREACERLGLRLRFAPLPKGTDGLLTEGGIVRISEAIAWRSRVEFTIYHEVTHHLLNEDGELIEYFTEVFRSNDAAYKAAIERCCHAGAAEFMASRQRVREAIAAHGFSVDLIERLAGSHGTSIIASAIQAAVCAPVDCYIVVCSHGVSPKFWPPDETLYVEQAATRHGMKYPLARFAPIPRDHLFHQVWQIKRRLCGPSYVPFPSGKRMASEHGEAKPLGERVAGILYLGHPPRSNQLALDLPMP